MIAASRWEWLDFDETEAEQVREFLSNDIDGEGVDALRIGSSVRDRVAELLFPGTSTQYTRLRYVILVAALLRKRGTTTENLARGQFELNLALDAANTDETGIIGRRTPGRDFAHLYWTAVRKWKLLAPITSDQRDVTIANGITAIQSKVEKDEDGSVLSEHRVKWDAEVITLADQFWAEQKSTGWPSIHCSQAEVDFILGQWSSLSETTPLSAVAIQIQNGKTLSDARYPWDLKVGRNDPARDELNRAKMVSLICWAIQLAYNFALLKKARELDTQGIETTWRQKNRSLDTTANRINKLYKEWRAAFEKEKSMLQEWASPTYWKELGSDVSRKFLAESARKLIADEADLESTNWSKWVEEREKVNPAPKLSNPNHLAGWSGTPEMAQRWDFRWGASVQQFVRDAENPRG